MIAPETDSTINQVKPRRLVGPFRRRPLPAFVGLGMGSGMARSSLTPRFHSASKTDLGTRNHVSILKTRLPVVRGGKLR